MRSSKGLVVVCGEGAGWAGLVGGFVVPDYGGEGQEALQDTCYDTWFGASSVPFEIELGFESVVDRLDDLTERFQEPVSRAGFLCFGGRADEDHPSLVQNLFEGGAAVAFVGYQGLARAGQTCMVDHLQSGAAFVCFGSGHRPGYGQTRWGGHQMETKTPKASGMGGTVAVFGPSRQVGTLLGLAASAALYWGRVQQPQVIMPRPSGPGQVSHDVGHHGAAAPQALVVGRPGRQVREPGFQMGMRVTEETGLVKSSV